MPLCLHYHLPSSLIAFFILFFWSTSHFDRTYLPRFLILSFINYISIFLLSVKYTTKSKLETHKLIVSTSFNFALSFVLFVILILLSSVTFFSDIYGTLVLSFLLSCLTVVPNLNGYFENGLFVTKATDNSAWSKEDKFALINVSTVLGACWLWSFCYGLNVRGEMTHYPISSCIGAYVGSLLVNLLCIIREFLTCFNTLWVY